MFSPHTMALIDKVHSPRDLGHPLPDADCP
jgi:hypothetical protein